MHTITLPSGLEILEAPLSRAEIEDMMGDDRTDVIRVNVAVNVDDLIEGDIETFDDIVSEKVTGTLCLQNIGFKPVDVMDFAVVFEVTGYVDDPDLDYID